MAPDQAPAQTASPTARRLLFTLGYAALVFVGYLQLDVFDIQEVYPLYALAIFLQLAPFGLPNRTDPFTPTAYSGLLATLTLAAGLAHSVSVGRVPLDILDASASRRVELVKLVLLAHIVGTLAYYAGYYAVGDLVRRRLGRGDPATAVSTERWNKGRLWAVYVLCALAFIPAYAYFQRNVGTGFDEVTALDRGKEVYREDTTATWLLRGVGLGMLPVALYLARVLPKPKIWQLGVVGGASLILAVLVTRMGQRGTFFYFGINLLVVLHYLYRRVPAWTVGLLLILSLGAVNEMGRWRARGAGGNDTTIAEATTPPIISTLAEHEADRQRMACMSVVFYAFPDRHEFLLGESWVGLTVSFIPRWMWPDKRQYTLWGDTSIVYQFTGFPAPLPFLAVLYANFAWPGIVIGMTLWGVFHRALYAWMLSLPTRSRVLLYAFVLTSFGLTLLQVSAAIQSALPIALALWFVRGGARDPDEEESPPLSSFAGAADRELA